MPEIKVSVNGRPAHVEFAADNPWAYQWSRLDITKANGLVTNGAPAASNNGSDDDLNELDAMDILGPLRMGLNDPQLKHEMSRNCKFAHRQC